MSTKNGIILRRRNVPLSVFVVSLWSLGGTVNAASFVPTSTLSHVPRTLLPRRTRPVNGLSIRRLPLVSVGNSDSDDSSSSSSNDGSSSLPPIPEEWRGEVLTSLSSIIDPDLNRDIVTLGFIKNLSLETKSRTVSFDLELTTPACPVKDEFLSLSRSAVLSLPWTLDTAITLTAQPLRPADTAPDLTGLSQIGAIIAVSSCKGGVGKSTTAVNLAYALQSLNARVGIFDADLYGPSLPTMITPENDAVQFVGRQIAPLRRNGVSLMSFGYVNEGSAIMRGPMITQLLDQFCSVTNWGALDYLVLDMPPGTGDIQLTLSQKMNITAAVIVTTPQELSFVDVVRGVDMFQEVNVPCVAVLENMAYLEQNQTNPPPSPIIDYTALKQQFMDTIGNNDTHLADALLQIVKNQTTAATTPPPPPEKLNIFGKGHQTRLSSQYGIEHTFSVPLQPTISANGDSGTPFIIQHPHSPVASTYKDLAKAVVSEVAKIKYSPQTFRITYDEEAHLMRVSDAADDDKIVTPAALRRDCRCAACVEELTGRQILMPQSVSEDVKPVIMKPCGNYAVSVSWSDGHQSLYPYKQIRRLLEENKETDAVGQEEEEVVLS